MQKSSLPTSFSDLKLDEGTKLEIHPVATKVLPNWAVENVEAPRRVFDTKKVRTVATIAGLQHPGRGTQGHAVRQWEGAGNETGEGAR